MYKIQTPTGETYLTEKPNFIRVHSNGVTFILTDRERAEGIAYHGTPYLWKDGTICYEVDGGDVYKDMEEVNNITFVALAETKVLDDDTAARHANVFPLWAVGVHFEKDGQKLPMRIDPMDGKLYRLNEGQDHTSVEGWNPSLTPALWTVVDVTHTGTIDDPIPAVRSMEFTYGLYYLDPEDGLLYLCKRQGEAEGGKITLHFLPHELVGQYFEIA